MRPLPLTQLGQSLQMKKSTISSEYDTAQNHAHFCAILSMIESQQHFYPCL